MSKRWIHRAQEVLDIEIEGIRSVQEKLDDSFCEAVELLAACKGRVVVTGVGKSGLIARKLAATLSSLGTPAFFMHPVEALHGDLGATKKGDVAIAISYSGKSTELATTLPFMRDLGIKIIAMTSGLSSPLALHADIVINTTIPREACPMNLAPTASTTAALVLGDALAICLIDKKSFTSNDFKKFHPGGSLGERLSHAVSDIMNTHDLPIIIAPATMKSAITALDVGKLGAVLLANKENTLLGILTDGDLRRAFCQKPFTLEDDVASYVTKEPMYARPEQSAAELMDIMEQKAITVLPVLDSSQKIVGIVHMHDILGKGKVRFAK